MRKTFMDCLIVMAQEDPNLYLVVGDVGFSVIEEFSQRFGNRFINAGIAEQNMIGVAAGLAMAGKNVFVYSIIPFLTMRCFEQIRIDICYQNLPVKLVGVGGGFSYGQMGLTHHALEDIAIMRSLSGMMVIAPATLHEAQALIPQLTTTTCPVYVRLSNYDEVPECMQPNDLILGSVCEYIHSDQYLIVITGNMLDLGYAVCRSLHYYGIPCGLVSMPTIKPLDVNFFITLKNLEAVFTIEEHSIVGGLGEALARALGESFAHKIIFKAFGIPDSYPHCIGTRHYLRDLMGLNVITITQEIVNRIQPSNSSLACNARIIEIGQ